MTERWLPIPGWEGFYEVSDLGAVRGIPRIITDKHGRKRSIAGCYMSLIPDRDGYPSVSLSRNGSTGARKPVHRLVLAAFVGARPDEMVTRHLNGIPTDNRLENLVYGTKSENMQDKLRHGTNWHANWTHCPSGHEYTGANVRLLPNGRRKCQTCLTAKWARARARQAKRGAAPGVPPPAQPPNTLGETA